MLAHRSLPTPSGPAPETPEPPAIAAAVAETAPLPKSQPRACSQPGDRERAVGRDERASRYGAFLWCCLVTSYCLFLVASLVVIVNPFKTTYTVPRVVAPKLTAVTPWHARRITCRDTDTGCLPCAQARHWDIARGPPEVTGLSYSSRLAYLAATMHISVVPGNSARQSSDVVVSWQMVQCQ